MITPLPPRRYRSVSQHRPGVLLQTTAVFAVIAVIVCFFDRAIRSAWRLDAAFSLTASFVIVQAGLLVPLIIAIFALKLRSGFLDRREKKYLPLVVEQLTAISAASAPPESFAPLYGVVPAIAGKALARSLAIQRGGSYQRLVAAAEVCGLIRDWKAAARHRSPATRCEAVLRLALLPRGTATAELSFALDDVEELVAVEAGRAISMKGNDSEAEAVFAALPAQTLLVRAITLASLRIHASALAAGAVPAALASLDPTRILAALEALASWRRALPLDAIQSVLNHPAAEIRAAAFRALPFAMCTNSLDTALLAGLADASPAVRIAAAFAAGRKAATGLMPQLSTVMNGGGDPGREAAVALSSLGNDGIAALERAVMSGGPAAPVATEALERYRLGRGWM